MTLPMTQIKKTELYRPPQGAMTEYPKHMASTLTMRLLSFLFKMGMKQQARINISDVSFYIERLHAQKLLPPS